MVCQLTGRPKLKMKVLVIIALMQCSFSGAIPTSSVLDLDTTELLYESSDSPPIIFSFENETATPHAEFLTSDKHAEENDTSTPQPESSTSNVHAPDAEEITTTVASEGEHAIHQSDHRSDEGDHGAHHDPNSSGGEEKMASEGEHGTHQSDHGSDEGDNGNHHDPHSGGGKKQTIDCKTEEIKIYFHHNDSVQHQKRKLMCKPAGEVHHDRIPMAVLDFERVAAPFIIGVWILLANIAKVGFHMTPKLPHIFPESCMLIVLGIIIGLLLFYTHAATVSPLTADVFFIYMLPPIILDAGYYMPNRLFFDHLGTILLFAVVGTIWNALSIGISLYALTLTGIFGVKELPVLHIFLFSSLISAVDPVAVLAVFEEIHVEEVLFILVFGESLLNDGITVVLYHMFEGFSHLGQENLILQDYFAAIASFFLVALGGTAIGIIWGFLTAFVTRFTKDVSVIEPVFIFVMSYLAYLNAEIFHFSGILSITFCGIAMKNYTSQNMSKNSQTTVRYAMKMLAQSSETIIFMFLGVSTVHDLHDWNWAFVGFTYLFCSLYRAMGTLMLSAVANQFRVQKISGEQQFIIAYGGLRGAVAFALVLTIDKNIIPEQPMFLTTTLAIVYFTVFFQGITIKPLVGYLGIKKSTHRKLTMNERLHERSMDYIMSSIEDILGKHGNQHIRDKFKRFNYKYLTPLLVRETTLSEPKFLETLSEIKMDEAINYMQQQGSPQEQIESFAALYRAAYNSAHPVQSDKEMGGETWNLDVGELQYKPTAKHVNDANFHHMLFTNEYKPVKQRRGTYKRHAVNDDDLQQEKPTHRNMNVRPQSNINKKYYQKYKKTGANGRPGQTAPGNTQKFNGTAIELRQDEIEKKMRNNPAFQPDETDPSSYDGIAPKNYKRQSVKGPVMAETTLPWRRGHIGGEKPANALVVQRRQSVDQNNDHTPTMAEMILPWKRDDDEGIRQAEQPYWAANEDYIATDSPSHTYLRKIGDPTKPSIHDIFKKRNSAASLYSIDEINDRRRSQFCDSRRSSTKDEAYWKGALSDMARRGMNVGSEPNSRRGSLRDAHQDGNNLHGASLLNTAITEEDSKTGPSPKSSSKAHVLNMDDLRNDEGDETKF